jgi:hypothetical protein
VVALAASMVALLVEREYQKAKIATAAVAATPRRVATALM